MGVKRLSIPDRSTKSAERKRLQKKRWFRNGQKWRAGSEGRISLVKRRHGLNRCRYKGQHGMKRGSDSAWARGLPWGNRKIAMLRCNMKWNAKLVHYSLCA